MICKTRVICYLLFATSWLLLITGSTWGSPSGLNNIPTTDIVPRDIFVLQSWLNTGSNKHPEEFMGFKYGLFKDTEIGVDWKANGETHGHATLQVKHAFDIDGDIWRGVVGIADLSDNRKHNGYFFPYAATSLDLKEFRLHFGFAPQPHNERFFAGIDKTVSFLERNLQLKADAIHINDREDVLYSAGFLYELGRKNGGTDVPSGGFEKLLDNFAKNIILESWVSLPSTGDEEVYTVKLNYVIRF